MCGIIGYIGDKAADQILIAGLKALEYRGYDSAGISVIEENKIKTIKDIGRVDKLEKEVRKEKLTGKIGIGHTRWATHGQPSSVNCHPHLNSDKTLSIVHNGIIENYSQLKKELIEYGYKFYSDTDTEVIVLLLDYYYKTNGNLLYSFNKTVKRLIGSFALALINVKLKQILAVRKDSPLIVGIGENENFVASDVSAMADYCKDYIYLDDLEFVIIDKNDVIIYDQNGNHISKEIKHLELTKEEMQKNGFSHFMLKEIFEQPRIVSNILSMKIRDNSINFDELFLDKDYLESIERIYFIGCGTAYYAGLIGRLYFEKFSEYKIDCFPASEFRYGEYRVDQKTLIIIISQSGETADSLAALRMAKGKGAKSIGIVNVVGSSIAREVDKIIFTYTGPEIAVASTKAYTAQILMLSLLSLSIAKTKKKIDHKTISEYLKQFLKLPKAIDKILMNSEKIKMISAVYYKVNNVFFIGRGSDYYSGLEGALKLKEIAYIQSEGYPSGELKHGPLAMISENTLVIALATKESLFSKMESNIMEVKSRGAKVFLLTTKNYLNLKDSDHYYLIEDINEMTAPILINVVQQLFSFYCALASGCDIDKPRNLAKSVTVE